MPACPGPTMRWLFRLPVYLYRCHCGGLLGHCFLLLIHRGRRTGRRYETVLEVMEYRAARREAVVMNAFGRNADWRRNIDARPGTADVIIGQECFVATHRLLDADEAVEIVAGYEPRHRSAAPIVRLPLRRLCGWAHRGTAGERRRRVAELPLIAFRPAA